MDDVVSILNLCIAGYVDDAVSIDATPDNQIINSARVLCFLRLDFWRCVNVPSLEFRRVDVV